MCWRSQKGRLHACVAWVRAGCSWMRRKALPIRCKAQSTKAVICRTSASPQRRPEMSGQCAASRSCRRQPRIFDFNLVGVRSRAFERRSRSSSASRRVELPCLCDIRSTARVLVFQFCPSPIAKIASGIGVQSNRLAVIGDRAVIVTLRLVQEASVVQGAGVLGVETNGLAVVGNRPVVVAFFLICEAAVVKGASAARVESKSLAVVGDRPVAVALFRISETPIVKGESAPRVESNGLGVVGNRPVVVAFFRISGASVVEGDSAGGVDSNSFVESCDRTVVRTVVGIHVALAHKHRVAGASLRRLSGLALVLRPESGEPLLLGFVAHALGSRLGRRFGPTLVLGPRSSEALLFGFLAPALGFRLRRLFGLALLLRPGSSEPLLLGFLALALGFRLGRRFGVDGVPLERPGSPGDRKSTRLNSSHLGISYAVFCLKKKTT